MNSENRVGRFLIHGSVFKRWEDQLPIMGNFVPLRVEHRFDFNTFDVIAFSPLFEVWPETCAAPWYELEIAFFPNAPAVIKAHRKDSSYDPSKVS